MITFKQYADIISKISKKLKVKKDIATAVLIKAQEKGINPLKWQSHITMLSTFVSLVTEYLPELFDKPLPYKITSNKHDWKRYEFSIKVRDLINLAKVKVAIVDPDGIGNYEVDSKVDGSHDITGVVGTAAAIKIFTTVVAIILDFVKAVQPNEVEFTAVKTEETGESRTKLYDRMAKRPTPKGYEYSSKPARGGSETIFTFSKKK